MMKKIYILILSLLALTGFAQVQTGQFSTDPEFFNADEEITLRVAGINTNLWNTSDVYLWAWFTDANGTQIDSPTNGQWENSDASQKMTAQTDGTFTFTFTPSLLFNNTDISEIGVLAKAKDANGDKKTQDHLIPVGAYQVVLNVPNDQISLIESGDELTIAAASNLMSDFNLYANNTLITSESSSMTFNHSLAITEQTDFELTANHIGSNASQTFTFTATLTSTPIEEPLPSGMSNGINYDADNPNEVTLVLEAPHKNFVHLLGDFNNWEMTPDHLMKKDTSNNKFWINISIPESSAWSSDFLFQYLIDGQIRIADPYSTLVLDPYNDTYIDEETFAQLPEYPSETTEIVSWVRLDQPDYEWEVTDFERPKQKELIIYEILLRDFDQNHSFQALINRLDYLEDLGINAIELMPVNEFDGNLSWGYNPSFHMALDKYYGSPENLKAFVDAAHQRGIAVILDVVYNHATGQSPYFRMYNDCEGCYGGQATAQNPLFNQNEPNTAFQFFNDIDHSASFTENWLDTMNTFWLEEYNIDGYRFDFTKGFTNTPGDGSAYDAARIEILKRMYNHIRTVDNQAYVILEHFAPNTEETELINHRATTQSEEPGMLVWANLNHQYNQATMGYDDSDFSGINYLNRGWSTASNVSYMESHDEERLMFKNLEYGANSNNYDITNMETALERMEMAGAFFLTIPGPKMIWQFGELGYDDSINHCQDGTIDPDCRTAPKPIVWNYLNDENRAKLRDFWTDLIKLRQSESIFQTSDFSVDANDDIQKIIKLSHENATTDEVEEILIIGNFGLEQVTISPGFPSTGNWYNYNENTSIEITQLNQSITLEAGEFMILLDKIPQHLATNQPESNNTIRMYPNPARHSIQFNHALLSLSIYNTHGQRIKSFEKPRAMHTPYKIDVLKQGLYFVKFIDENGREKNLKLIKK
ncbi:MAG: T9SS type A sorting domain-containing protein [Psychroflexus sp.]|nr:T9SS type A sorting domain-containing protein [Psychroflexus sp.]MDN6309381.1 T9SS type A sorting domain-containing protein [Psychroflexus sp.]